MSGRVAEGEFLRKKKWQRRFGGFAVGGNSDFIFSATVTEWTISLYSREKYAYVNFY